MEVSRIGPAATGLWVPGSHLVRAQILEALVARSAALCLYEFAGQEAPLEVTVDFVYVRLHGPAGPHQGSYSDAALQAWAERIGRWSGNGLDVYCYFDNDDRGCAPRNVLRLRQILPSRIAGGTTMKR